MYIIALMIRDIEFNISTQSRGAEKNLDLPYYIVKKKKVLLQMESEIMRPLVLIFIVMSIF